MPMVCAPSFPSWLDEDAIVALFFTKSDLLQSTRERVRFARSLCSTEEVVDFVMALLIRVLSMHDVPGLPADFLLSDYDF